MSQPTDEFVERVRDVGQWFERSVRVDYFPTAPDAGERTLEKAALGAYEVLGCTRAKQGGSYWLDVRLLRLSHR